jgi:hypothetical protein
MSNHLTHTIAAMLATVAALATLFAFAQWVNG